jgi:hypothetical protein
MAAHRGNHPSVRRSALAGGLQKYQQTPEYQRVNRGTSLEAFKASSGGNISIVCWAGRSVVFFLPLLYFIARRKVGQLTPALLGICLVRCRARWVGTWSRVDWWTIHA